MKVRDSGMPDNEMWSTFFDAESIFRNLGIADPAGVVVDFGSGYGTFCLAAARSFERSRVIGLDIEAGLNAEVAAAARAQSLSNLEIRTRDFISQGSGLADGSVDIAMLFNILHAEDPVGLLREAERILKPGGAVAVIHWNHDPATPRGPKMEIRPRPEQTLAWAREAGLAVPDSTAPVARYHYGFVARKQGTR